MHALDPLSARASRGFAALAAVTWGLLVFGASVRVHGAGLSCPDWPLCFGEVVPRLDFRIFLEWGHRVLASVISLGFVALGGLVLAKPALRARAGVTVGLAGVALVVQIVLGGLTVLHLLAYWSVTLHLLTGNLFFVLLVVASLQLRGAAPAVSPLSRGVRALGVATAGAVAVQMGLGGLVSSNYAGLACTEWPTCIGGVWFPALDGSVGLQIFHRLGGYTVAALATALFVLGRGHAAMRTPVSALFALVVLQVGLGVANVLLAMPVELAIAHSATADLIVLATTLTVYAALRQPVAARAHPLVHVEVA
ncbi:MAG: COX15/CtaA family protein [Myxococcota bacterium]